MFTLQGYILENIKWPKGSDLTYKVITPTSKMRIKISSNS